MLGCNEWVIQMMVVECCILAKYSYEKLIFRWNDRNPS